MKNYTGNVPQNSIRLFVISLLALSNFAGAQNILRVSNMPGANAPYSSIQAAHDAASSGDIILVDGSPNLYGGGVNISKKLKFLGPGYFLLENTGRQASPYSASVEVINFYGGSEGSSVNGFVIWYGIGVNASNINISNNYVLGRDINFAVDLTNITINGNFMGGGVVNGGGTQTNIIVSNNYIANAISWHGTTYAIVSNNIIAGSGDFSNSSVFNNIFLASGINPISNTLNSTIQNNVFVAASQTNAAASVFSADPASLFVGLSGNTTDSQFQLKSGSPAIGAGAGGVDAGIFGGSTTHYGLSGIRTGQPTITNMVVPATIPQSGTLNVKVSAKVN